MNTEQENELTDSLDYVCVTGKDPFGMQHIMEKVTGKILCGVRIKHVQKWAFYCSGFGCYKCEEIYLSGKAVR